MSSFLVVLDTPGIKQFVFGTDPLKEIRGASTQLVEVNQSLESWLTDSLARHGGSIEPIYSNGGAAQFVFRNVDEHAAKAACHAACRKVQQLGGGQVRLAYGLAEWDESRAGAYKKAVQQAHERLQWQRETSFGHRTATTWPLVRECETASNRPAEFRRKDAGQTAFLSAASKAKRDATATGGGRWREWMEHIRDRQSAWPDSNLHWDDFNQLAAAGGSSTYLAIVYADGNAMGKLVPKLDSKDAYREFSTIVDESIRNACYEALSFVCREEIDKISKGHAMNTETPSTSRLSAEILLLGGDDLCVALPANRALSFAECVCEKFRQATSQALAALPAGPVKDFFRSLHVSEFTISCGVAIAHASYPFPLLLDLAEELLKSAKRGGSDDSQCQDHWSPSYVDFHVVTSSASHSLKRIRDEDFYNNTSHPRTMRPLRLDWLVKLREAVEELYHGNNEFPRSKLHALFESALRENKDTAAREVRSVFARCARDQRIALWKSLVQVSDANLLDEFPWVKAGGKTVLPIPDLVEACDLYANS